MAKNDIKMGDGVFWNPLRYYWFNIAFKMFLVFAGAVSTNSLTEDNIFNVICAMISAGGFEILRMKGKNDTPPDTTVYKQTELKDGNTTQTEMVK